MSNEILVKGAWEAFAGQNYAQAAHLASSILRTDRGNIPARACHLMSEYYLDADSDATLRGMKKLLKVAPHVPMLHIHVGSVYAFMGDMKRAKLAYETADALEPDDPVYFLHLTEIKTFTSFDERCQQVLDSYENGENNTHRLSAICFSLAKVYNDLGDYEKAMKFCMEANTARNYTFAPLRFDKHASALKAFGQSGKFSELPTSGLTSQAPVFIVGMPRSGTSLAETILGRHPRVRACGEMDDAPNIEGRLIRKFPALRNSPIPQIDIFSAVGTDDLETEAKAWLAKVKNQKGPRFDRFTDKLPGNTLHLGLIAKLFPNARVIYVRRNALDCCISNLFARFGEGHPYSTQQNWLGFYYRYVERIMEDWREMIDLPILDVHYEDLVTDTEAETRRMVDFAGLKWDEACLDHTAGSNEVRTASVWQARQPINKNSVDRWRRYEPWIQDLIEALGGYEALGVEKGPGIKKAN